ncbi:MAG TPA: glycosyltransferase family 2 protein [Pirellulales bacterium]|jgi:dolichol-phosphate mannosyltransferase|nr:glycosyltransferase family 2 protein [Pirellulales bacterium]
MSRPLDVLSLVFPVYNEEQVLPLLLPRVRTLLARLPCEAEVIFVNDGSSDRSAVLLAQAAAEEPRFKVLEFSRNFGHQVAITAGIDIAAGDAVVVMDSDLQDPPELVLEMVEKYRAGYDVVYAQRRSRQGESWFKRSTAAGFYRLMRTAVHRDLPDNVGDFRLMSRAVVEAFKQLREQHRFVRGMVTWLGFRQTAIVFDRPARAAGETKYPLRKMMAFAWRAISSFSGLPLRLAMGVGLTVIAGSAAYTLWAAACSVAGSPVAGMAWLVCLQCGLFGATLFVLGLMGDYIARIYDELKERPLYIVRAAHNLSAERFVDLPRRAAVPIAARRASDHPRPAPHFRLLHNSPAAHAGDHY